MIEQLKWDKDNFENIEEAWKGDLWDRKRLGVQLTNYVDRLNCGAVLALDARWGEGKTWFVRHWAKHLSDDHNVIYLDAFANDYLEDPFLVISSEITSCLSKDDDVDQEHINIFKEKAAAAYHALLPSLPKVLLTLGLNLISGGVLGTLAQQVHEAGEKVIESATDALGEKIQESIEEKIENHEADKNTLLAFKQELSQLAEELEKPLVFIIDELDRCRPDFAIRLIERIKHFFDIPKIVFVLVMDKTQFSKVVCHNYGYDEKFGEEYLDKFVDFSIKLNPAKLANRLSFIQNKLNELGVNIEANQFKKIDYLFSFMALHCKTTTRELIKLLHCFNLLALSELNRNHILVIYLFLGKKLKDKKSTIDVYKYIVEWFKAIVDEDLELIQHVIDLKDEMESRNRTFTTHQLYGQILMNFRSVFIANTLMQYFDEYQKNTNSDYYLQQASMQPMHSYNNEDYVDFKQEWEFYISSGLSS